MSSTSCLLIECYHTCSNRGSRDTILESAPFLSRPQKQWLSQGYYFWPESEDLAQIWGRVGYHSQYAIIKCNINLDISRLFDLAGRIIHNQMLEDWLKSCEEKISDIEAKTQQPIQKPNATVSGIIEFQRLLCRLSQSDEFFPFDAIRARDEPPKSVPTLPFVAGKQGILNAHPRVQLCLLQHAKNKISEKEIIFMIETNDEWQASFFVS